MMHPQVDHVNPDTESHSNPPSTVRSGPPSVPVATSTDACYELDTLNSRNTFNNTLTSHNQQRRRSTCSPSGPDGDRTPHQARDGETAADAPQVSRHADAPPEEPTSRWLSRFWSRHVNVDVDMGAARDHLALERTFLGYLRTSSMWSMAGVILLQLFTISQRDSGFGYTLMGKPLATTCYFMSILTVFIGAIRTWRHQHGMIDGKAIAGGVEMNLLAGSMLTILVVFFAFLLAIDVTKESGVDTLR